jgi:prepilin signal peptidase PulO-like enzyme (type II secretory pathway)
MDIVILILVGWLAGVIVNALADYLPYHPYQRPLRYINDSPRPLLAWSGILAFVLSKRKPAIAPDTPPLSWRYPLTEITIIILFLLVHQASPTLLISTEQYLLLLFYMALLTLITVVDLEHRLIQFVVMIPAILIGLVDAALTPPPDLGEALRGGAFGFTIFFLLYLGGFGFTYILGALRGRQINTVAFGFGDVMLITFAGVLLGVAYTILAIFIAVFLGAFGAILYLVVRIFARGGYSFFSAIPYGPYIVIALIALLLHGREIWRLVFGYLPAG